MREDSTLSIACGFNGVASEDVTWKRDGSAIPLTSDDRLSVTSSRSGSKLTVSNVKAADGGQYVCQGRRDGQEASSSVDITVAGTCKVLKRLDRACSTR